ncbi:acetolactate synthase catalytic subunit [Sphingopyxis sp. Root1497]|uniref:acetolactate synthase catalytic subunit n=1 Tax=Sphingopyxis sp. Root1497 TaxID=1736474 RepID=UPI0006FFCB87|nr:acetolactate synthase catalytic subunit [Sphingopyxis sp. Root1497]KQZ61048.1 acetolactate synthase catalytic subunit [Sphingopyxis sp. Root1497]
MSDTVAQAIAKALIRHEVEIIFGQSNPSALMLAAEDAGVRQILFRTENAGGVMAEGYARITNKIGVIAVQNGPAATLAVAPMAEAIKASIPMLVLVQDVPTDVRDRNAFQDFDHLALFSGVSKWTRTIDDPARVDDYIDLAMMHANGGRPGPVVLLLPKNVLNMPVQPAKLVRSRSLGSFPLDRPRPDAQAVEAAARLLGSARAPLIMAGGGVHVSGAATALSRLSDAAHIPVATTNMGKGAIDETSPLSIGVAANVTGRTGPAFYTRDLVTDADVILFVGNRTNENGTDSWQLTSSDAQYIHVDIDPVEIGRNYESVRLLGDARAALDDLTEAVLKIDLSARRAARPAIEARIREGREKRGTDLAKLYARNAEPISPLKLMADLDPLIGPDDIVVADASLATLWVTAFLTARAGGQRFLTPRGIAGLGWGMPYALGAKLARPDAKVIAIVGDGGFAHVWSEVETAVRERIPVVTIVLNNGELAYQRLGEEAQFGRATSAIEFAPVDHAAMASTAGAVGIRVEHVNQIRPALEAALKADLPTVVEVIVDPKALPPHSMLNEMIGATL